MPDQINKVSVEGVTYQITPSDTGTFTGTSNDASSPSSWTSVALLVSGETNGSIFTKISSMFKNIRYLYDKLGGSDLDQSSGSIIQQLGELETNKADIDHTHDVATTAATGFMPALDGDSTKCLLGDGTWGSAGSTYATVSTAAPGLAPTLSGSTAQFLRGDGTWQTPPDTNTTYAFSNKGVTLAWNTQSTIAVCGGTNITVKMPANPNTNTTYGTFTSAANGLVPAAKSGSTNYATTGYVLTGAGWRAGTKYNTDNNTTYGTSAGCYGSLSGTTLILNPRNFRV